MDTRTVRPTLQWTLVDRTDTGVDDLPMCMQEIESLQELNDSTPDEVFVKSFRAEYDFHVAEAHLCGFKDKDNMVAIRTVSDKRIQQSAHIASSFVCTVLHTTGDMVV